MSINKAKKLYRYSVDDILYDSRPKVVVQDQFKHLKTNRKKEQMQEDYYTEVERENRILLEKIRKIMKSNKHSYIPSSNSGLSPTPRSKPQRYAMKRPELPQALPKKDSFLNFNEIRTPNPAKNLRIDDRANLYSNLSQSVNVERPRRLSPLVVDIREKVFQKNLVLNGRNFLVEIVKGKKDVKVVASDPKSFTTYSIEIEKKDAIEFMGGREDWDLLSKFLHLDGTELSLYADSYYD